MKKKISLSLFLALCAPLALFGQVTYNAWTAGGSYSNLAGGGAITYGTTNWAVGSIASAGGKSAYATYLNAKSDLSSSVVGFWVDNNGIGTTSGQAPGLVLQSNSTTTVYFQLTGTNLTASTNGLVVGNPVVIRHLTNDNYEVRFVGSVTATNVVLVGGAPTSGVIPGDIMYPYTQASITTCGAATLIIGPSSGPIFSEFPNVPPLFSLNFTSAGTIQTITGSYQ